MRTFARVVSVVAVVGCTSSSERPISVTSTELVPPLKSSWVADGDGFRVTAPAWTARATANGFAFQPGPDATSDVEFSSPQLVRRGADFSSRNVATCDGDTLKLERGAATEELVFTAAGLEQRWHFAKAPAGEGAFEVRVPVRGALVATNQSGLHFSVGNRLVRYGLMRVASERLSRLGTTAAPSCSKSAQRRSRLRSFPRCSIQSS